MTDLQMIQKITGESDSELIEMLFTMAQEKICALTNRSKIITALIPAARDWAVVAYNRLGMEGETSRSEAGISSAFAEIPKDVNDAIRQYRLGRVSGHAYEKRSDENISSEEENN